MRAFITGITGFVGSHLAEHLLACGDEVLGCSLTSRWPPGAPVELDRQLERFSLDISDPWPQAARQRLAEFRPEAVYHLAAISAPGDCGDKEPTARALAVNVQGTESLVDCLADLDKSPRLLLTSSSYVYEPVDPEHPQQRESSPVEPGNPYGMTKLAAERVALQASQQGRVPAIVARAFQHAGPRQESRMMLAEWVSQIVQEDTSPIRVHRRDAWLDLTDVRDVVRAYRLLVLQAMPGKVYNVGSGVNRRCGDILDQLLQLVDCDRPVEELYPGPQQRAIAVIDQLQQATDWQPEISLRQTLIDTLNYWKWRQSATQTDPRPRE